MAKHGMHKMPGGHMMKDSAMKKMMGPPKPKPKPKKRGKK